MSNAMWDERYAQAAASGSTVWSKGPNAWIASTVESLPPGRAVDLAAGEGRNALWLASRGWAVTAVDFSAEGLAIGRARAAELGIGLDWVVADARTWVAPEPVDLVVVAYLQLPQADLARAIANAMASLAPGGTLAVIGHDKDNLERGVGGPQDPRLLQSVDELRAAANGLEILECAQVERPVDDGRVAIDTVLLARKP
jgi:SAM-dependent methyltransferase